MLSRLKNFFTHLLFIPIALILLFEEWGWIPLSAFFSKLAETLLIWKKLERFIETLSPRMSLFILLIPMLTLLPMKFLGLYFIDQGLYIIGVGVILISKIVGTAFFARLFSLTLPNLLKMNWFATYYPRWISWKNSVLAYFRSSILYQFYKGAKALARSLVAKISGLVL